MTKFVEVEHEGIEVTGLVPESALGHYAKGGWTPVARPEAEAISSATLPEGAPTSEWSRADLDAYAARHFSLDTTTERTKADVLARIRGAAASQPTSSTTETPAAGDDNEES